MEIVLNNGEQIVKSWYYGKAKGLIFTRGKYNLTLTNKKIICMFENKKESSRQDFDINEIKGVSASYVVKRRFFIFKRGQLNVSLFMPSSEHTLVGLNAIRGGGGFLAFLRAIPILGLLFGGSKTKIKVDVNAAKDVVANLSALVLKYQSSAV